MGRLVLVRHGESRWNLDNKFTGWVDVPLSERGIQEASLCAKHCTEYDFSICFTSDLIRSQATLQTILARQNRTGIFQHNHDHGHTSWIRASNRCNDQDIPIFTSVLLNERYYGKLQGMNKEQAQDRYGSEKVIMWRRGYTQRPPGGESLKDTYERMHPYFGRKIVPHIKHGHTVLLTAHGNTLRAAIKHLEGISDDDISFIDLPKAKPIVYEYKRGQFTRIEGEYAFNRPLR